MPNDHLDDLGQPIENTKCDEQCQVAQTLNQRQIPFVDGGDGVAKTSVEGHLPLRSQIHCASPLPQTQGITVPGAITIDSLALHTLSSQRWPLTIPRALR